MDKLAIGIISLIIFGITISCCLDFINGSNDKVKTQQESMFDYYDEAIQRANEINMGGN